MPGTVLALGAASFLTDLSSEMIYPLIPVFLTGTLGAGAFALGVVEGLAESTSAFVKVFSGRWTDRAARRKPFVLAGYGIAGVVRPLMAAAGSWVTVVAIRFMDRVGKGVRSAPRDALISDVTPSASRGAAFGLHRSLDHLGAVTGPLVAAVLLAAGLGLRTVFALAVVPAVLVMIVIVRFVHDAPRPAVPAEHPAPAAVPGPLRVMLVAVVVFTLGNSADAFLLLRLGDAGVAPIGIAMLWSAFHVVKVVATWAGGRLSDRRGRKGLVVAGWGVYAAIYLGMASIDTPALLIALFLGYGIYFGLTEPVERAWVADLAPAGGRGTAFGWYHAAVGIGALPANLLFGGIWAVAGPGAAFGFGSAMAVLGAVILLRVPTRIEV